MYSKFNLLIFLIITTLIVAACGGAQPTVDTAALDKANAALAEAEAKAATAQAGAEQVAAASKEEVAAAKATADAAMAEADTAKAEAEAAKTEASSGEGKGVVISELGRDYLAYPDTAGTLTFSNCWGGSRVELIEKWITEFNKFYPNIKIINDVVECTAIFQQQVTRIGGGAAPDVLMVQSRNFPSMVASDSLLPLNDWIERDGIDPNWFYDSEWTARQVNGQVYGLPNVTGGAQYLLFYKTEYLEQAGIETIKTWQDLEALVEVAKANDMLVMDPSRGGEFPMFPVLLYANGGQLWNDDFTEITWNSPEGLEAAEWMLKFVKLQADSYDQLTAAGDRRDVVQAPVYGPGPYIAVVQGSWFFLQLENEAPELSYAATTFPRNANNPDSQGLTPVYGGWAFAIPKDISQENQAAAWEWIKFTTSSDFSCEFTIAQSRPSPQRRCNEDPRLSEQNPYWDQVQASLDQGKVVRVSELIPEMQEILYNMEDAIVFEEMTPAEALETFAAEAQKLLDEQNSK